MRLICSLMATGILLGLSAHGASAAAFDGKWLADLPAEGKCNYTGTMVVIVAGHDVSGHVQNGISTQGNLTGKIDDSGDGDFTVNGRYHGTFKFHSDHFEASWDNGNCDRHAQGDRALDDSQKAAVANDRKQHQAVYASLVARAKAGDNKLDYNQLRAEAVYAEGWNFYDKTSGLLQQANVAAKGKDCATALEKTEEVIKIDFTNDAAHDLRSDCLKQTGDRAQASIEAGIAKGLIHSLMDSGDGRTEKTAYVVGSQREEMDVLANRHIQIRARQTELRGADGRYYDVIQGIAVTSDGHIIDATVHDVYFDISGFVAGRASLRAVVETAQAAIH
jgi:hypothetical protein